MTTLQKEKREEYIARLASFHAEVETDNDPKGFFALLTDEELMENEAIISEAIEKILQKSYSKYTNEELTENMKEWLTIINK